MGIYSEQSDQIDQIATALAKVQGELRDADRNVQGHGYDYADLSQVIAIIRPIASKHGISFTQPLMDGPDKRIVVETKLLHTSGQWMRSSFSLNAVENKKMSGAQSVGAACTYGRRYALAAVFGITQQDDDASNKLIDDVLNEFQLARIRDDEQKAIDMIAKLPDKWKEEIRNKLTKVETQWLIDIQKKRSAPDEQLEVPRLEDLIIDREMLENIPEVISENEMKRVVRNMERNDGESYWDDDEPNDDIPEFN